MSHFGAPPPWCLPADGGGQEEHGEVAGLGGQTAAEGEGVQEAGGGGGERGMGGEMGGDAENELGGEKMEEGIGGWRNGQRNGWGVEEIEGKMDGWGGGEMGGMVEEWRAGKGSVGEIGWGEIWGEMAGSWRDGEMGAEMLRKGWEAEKGMEKKVGNWGG